MPSVTLTTEEKVLLWIYRFMPEVEGSGYVWTAPPSLTQKGIEKGLLVRQAYVSRTLTRLIEQGLVKPVLAHTGPGRRKNVYILTPKGTEAAMEILRHLEKSDVVVVTPQGEEKVSFIDAAERLNISRTKLAVELREGKILVPSVRKNYMVGIPKVKEMVGRTSESIKLIRAIKDENKHIIHIYGLSGIGKTTLVANVVKERKENSVFWYDVKAWSSPQRVTAELKEFLERLGYSTGEGEKAIYRLLWEKGRNIILVFDNVHNAPEELVELFKNLAEKHSGTLFLISKVKLRWVTQVKRKAVVMELKGLDRVGSGKLMKSLNMPSDLIPQVYKVTQGHPLAIYFIAASNVKKSLINSDIAEFIKKELESEMDPEHRRVIELLSVFREPLNIPMLIHTLQNLKDKSISEHFQSFIPSIEFLMRTGTILQGNDGSYQLHNMIADVVQSEMPASLKKKYHSIAAEYHRNVAQEGEFWGISPRQINVSIMEYIYHSIQAGRYGNAIKAMETSGTMLIKQGYTTLIPLVEGMNIKALGPRQKIDYYLILGDLYLTMNDARKARKAYSMAMSSPLATGREKKRMELAILNRMARCNLASGNIKGSLELIKSAVDSAEKSGDDRAVIKAYNNMGVILANIGRFKGAENIYRKAIKLASSVGDEMAEARSRRNLGVLYMDMERYDDALKEFEKAAEGEKLNWMEKGEILEFMADAYRMKKDYAKALSTLQEVLESYRADAPSHRYYMPLVKYLDVALIVGDTKARKKAIKEIKAIFTRVRGNSESLSGYHREEAILELLRIALRSRPEDFSWIMEMDGEVLTSPGAAVIKPLVSLGNKMYSAGLWDIAIYLYTIALSKVSELKDREGEVSLLTNIAIAEAKRGNRRRARKLLNQAYEISREMNNRRGMKRVNKLLKEVVS